MEMVSVGLFYLRALFHICHPSTPATGRRTRLHGCIDLLPMASPWTAGGFLVPGYNAAHETSLIATNREESCSDRTAEGDARRVARVLPAASKPHRRFTAQVPAR